MTLEMSAVFVSTDSRSMVKNVSLLFHTAGKDGGGYKQQQSVNID